jgi:hypothetical protein
MKAACLRNVGFTIQDDNCKGAFNASETGEEIDMPYVYMCGLCAHALQTDSLFDENVIIGTLALDARMVHECGEVSGMSIARGYENSRRNTP